MVHAKAGPTKIGHLRPSLGTTNYGRDAFCPGYSGANNAFNSTNWRFNTATADTTSDTNPAQVIVCARRGQRPESGLVEGGAKKQGEA